MLRLGDSILASGVGVLGEEYDMVYFPGDDLFAVNRPRGLPIGNLTSQFWANCYLNSFDQFVAHELGCPAYLRYVDDFLLFGDSKRTAVGVEGGGRDAAGGAATDRPDEAAQVQPVARASPGWASWSIRPIAG